MMVMALVVLCVAQQGTGSRHRLAERYNTLCKNLGPALSFQVGLLLLQPYLDKKTPTRRQPDKPSPSVYPLVFDQG